MTTTVEPPAIAPADEDLKSLRVAALRLMLDDPAWSAHADDIREAIVYLTATAILEA